MRIIVAAMAAGLLWLLATPAMAHVGGKVSPEIEVQRVSANGRMRQYAVVLTDDSGEPVKTADVSLSARMDMPRAISLGPVRLNPVNTTGTYSGEVQFPMPGTWRISVSVKGPEIAPGSADFAEAVSFDLPTNHALGNHRLPFKSQKTPVAVDLKSVAVQAVHLILAVVWVGGHAFMVLQLKPALVTIPGRNRRKKFLAHLMKRYSHGAVLSVTLIIASGIYNAFYNVPVPLTVIRRAPLGDLYLGLLAAKIGLLLSAMVVGLYAARVIVPRLQRVDAENIGFEKAFRQMLAACTINLSLGIMILTLAVGLSRVHLIFHAS